MRSATMSIVLLLLAEGLSAAWAAAVLFEQTAVRYSARTVQRLRRALLARLCELRTDALSVLSRPPPEKSGSDALDLTIHHLSAAFSLSEDFAGAYQLHFQKGFVTSLSEPAG